MIRLRYLLPALALAGLIATTPAAVLPKRNVQRVNSLMTAGQENGYYPGASIAVGSRAGILYDTCYGWRDYDRSAAVTPQDVYDLASVTKIVATTLAVMRLYDERQLALDNRVGSLLPTFAGTEIAGITLRELLTHTSGLGNIFMYRMLFHNPTGADLISTRVSPDYPRLVDRSVWLCNDPRPDTIYISGQPYEGYRRAGEYCYVSPAVDTVIFNGIVDSFKATRRGKYLYSDLNFHLLMMIVERTSGKRLNDFVAEIYGQMDMRSTGFRPLEWMPAENIVPTENDVLMARGPLRGYTHDEIAAVSDNVGGNAGLFSNTEDLSKYCRMILSGGELNGRMIISPATVKLFTAGPRPLGFQHLTSSPMYAGGFGHTGYTGTMVWIDPARDRFMVFLSNRVNPSRTNQGLVSSGLRTKVWEAIVAK
ncbi:MAG: beta-lactamase family protein [Rikenellaceae bacterium]|jgi:CubicO group peptidase (beta-lactamase class C family)|nr:beta-lactamase family protein [Rikenellaceae bacterium]